MTNPPLRHERIWTLIGLGFVLVVVYLSLTPEPPDASRILDVKAGHFAAYAWLMLWFAQIHATHRTRFAIAIALVAMGVALEYIQGTTTYRTFAYADMIDNTLGVIAGWTLASTRLGGALGAIEMTLSRREASK